MANLLVLIALLESLCALGLSCSFGDLRLRNGSDIFEGRMELCDSNEVWGTVCHDRLDPAGTNGQGASTVACRQLGFSDQDAILVRGPRDPVIYDPYSPGTGNIHLDELICTGSESALVDCQHGGVGMHNCDHDDDAGVICMPSDCTDRELRLVDGGTETEGRVEMCLSQTWFTLSATGWGVEEATVVCTQLGMSGQGASPMSGSPGVGPIMTADCTGQESSLGSCTLNNTGRNYDHTNDAGVSCSGSSSSQTTTVPPAATTGQMATTTTEQGATTVATTVPTQPATTADTTTVQTSTIVNTPSDTTNVDTTTSGADHTSTAQTTSSSTSTRRETTTTPGSGLNHTEILSTSESADSETTTTEADLVGERGQLWAIVATTVLGFAVIVLVGLSLVCVCYSVRKRRNERMLQLSLRRTRSRDYIDRMAPTNTLEVSLHQCDAYDRPTNLNNLPTPLTQSPIYSSIEKASNLDADSGIMLQSCSAYGNGTKINQQTTNELEYDYIHDYDYMYPNVNPKTGKMID